MLDDELLVVPLVEPDIEPELDDEPDVEPGDDIDDELDGGVVLLPEDALLLVSGVVELDALPDGVDVDGDVLLLEADDDGVVLVPDVDDDVVAGGVTVTLLVDEGASEGDLLQAASDSADSKASASIEVRFIRGSWSR